MYRVSRQIFSHHAPKLLYDVVNDTDAYKLFVPFCSESAVIEEKGDKKLCRLVFSKGMLSRELITRNTLFPNERIEIELVQGDFSHLAGEWRFVPMDGGTMVELDFEYAFSQAILNYTFGQIFKPLTEELVDVFCQRANAQAVR